MAEALTKTGRYQIVGELGRGSMGIVYQGYDPIIGRTVAIKTMITEGQSPQEFHEYKARFQREAQAAGILTHPNIITVYDFGEDNGILYLAMEFLEGKSLEKLAEEQNVLPVETILPIYDQVCSALDFAHQNGIVHRDVKPANIMILRNGIVKMTDFGIAKMMSMGMTQAGQILGTPNYMSPEQVKGRQVDGRSDIFSLGVILYELVTGEKPFGGQNITTVIYKIINENPIPPRELDGTIHSGLNYVIAKALAKNPDERYQSCRELAEDLRNYKTLGSAATPQGTVVLKVAPIIAPPPPRAIPPAPPEAPPPAPALRQPLPEPNPQGPPQSVAETPIASSLNIQVIPPAHPRSQEIPQITWVLGALLVVAVLVMTGYFVVVHRQNQTLRQSPNPVVASTPGSQQTPPPAVPVTVPAAAPTTEATTPTQQPPEVKAPETPAKPAVTPRQELSHAHAPVSKAGLLLVSSNITGAKITIDGRSDASWVTPYTILDLPAGTHNVLISKAGYEDFQQSVTIEGGQTSSVMGNLSTPIGEIDITTTPSGVEVLIDGKSYGPSPVRTTVAAGEHTYTVKRPGVEPYESRFNMLSGGIVTKMVNLGGAVTTGIVEVRTIPPGATVQADGSLVGGLTPTSFRLSPGSHTLVISLTGYPPTRRQVTVSENATIPVNINLTSQ
jgi:serine/threonine protein kinase